MLRFGNIDFFFQTKKNLKDDEVELDEMDFDEEKET